MVWQHGKDNQACRFHDLIISSETKLSFHKISADMQLLLKMQLMVVLYGNMICIRMPTDCTIQFLEEGQKSLLDEI
jgi:hypothetical protein